jgi:hypothetical protein
MAHEFEQLPRESDRAFAAFSVYLSLGPERSLELAAERLGKSKTLMERWSKKYGWPARVQAHGAHLATVEREATEVLVRGKAAEWLKRQQEVKEREWRLHERCMAAAERALEAFMVREKIYVNLADIARIVEVGSKMGRLSSGMATDKTEVTGEEGGPIRVEVEAALDKIYGKPIPGEVIEVQSEECRVENGERKLLTSPPKSQEG